MNTVICAAVRVCDRIQSREDFLQVIRPNVTKQFVIDLKKKKEPGVRDNRGKASTWVTHCHPRAQSC